MEFDADVIVLGAGLAGLAAAHTLSAADLSVLVLEARDRVGGRVFTTRDSSSQYPIELGPEWVGSGGEFRELLDAAGANVQTARGEHLERVENALLARENWKETERLLKRIKALVTKGPDMPLLEALEACCTSSALEAGRESLVGYVQGFHSADPARVSSRWLLEVEENEPADASSGHALAGLDRGVNALSTRVTERATLHLATIARRVHWGPSHVEVEADSAGASRVFRARQLVCALPLAILKLDAGEPGGVEFLPPLEAKQPALDLLETGPVVKVVLVFDEPFWTRVDQLKRASFIHQPGVPFPTWWTTHPVGAPVLTGWVAGPLVGGLGGAEGDSLLDIALDSAATALGVSRGRLQQSFRGWHTHDWNTDPFARGAYSYVLSGGTEAHAVLSQPLHNTLFFAGEAACGKGHNATMEGALQSGRRAARQLLSAT